MRSRPEPRRLANRYTTSGQDNPTVERPDGDDYLFDLFERIRPTLPFGELAFLYEIVETSRRLIPEAFLSAPSDRADALRRPKA